MTDVLSALIAGGELLLTLAALALAGFALVPGAAGRTTPGARLVLLGIAGCLAIGVMAGAWLNRHL